MSVKNGNEVTAITNPEIMSDGEGSSAIYTIDGKQINATTHSGLYIQNGRKVVKK